MKQIKFILIIFILLILTSCLPDKKETLDPPIINGLKSSVELYLGDSFDVLEGVLAFDGDGNDITDNIVISVTPEDVLIEGSVITPEYVGAYLVSVSVKDKNNQETTLSVFVDCLKPEETLRESPVFSGVKNVALLKGDSYDLLEGINVLDHDGIDLTSEIIISTNPDLTIENNMVTPDRGSYLITLSVMDKENIESNVSYTLNVLEESHQIIYDFSDLSHYDHGFKVFEAQKEVEKLIMLDDTLIYNANLTPNNGTYSNRIEKELELEENTNLFISISVKSDVLLEDVFLGLFEDDLLLTNKTVSITSEYQNISLNYFNLNKNTVKLVLAFDDVLIDDFLLTFKEYEITFETNEKELLLSFNEDDNFEAINWEDGVSNILTDNESLTFEVINPASNIWEQRIEYLFDLEPNKQYILTYDVESNEDHQYEFILRADGLDYIWSDPSLLANNKKTFTHNFRTNKTNYENLLLLIQLGGASEPLEFKISNIKLKSFDNLASNKYHFTQMPNGFGFSDEASINPEFYIDNDLGSLVYKLDNFGEFDYFNKIFLENVLLNEGSLYKIEIEIYATKELEGFFAVNQMGGWNPYYTNTFTITNTPTRITFLMDSLLTLTTNTELLFQFGEYNSGEATIYFNNLNITEYS